jgi:hypothetical protein
LQHTGPVARAEVEDLEALKFFLSQCCSVAFSQVNNMNVVADASPIWLSPVVVAKNCQEFELP